MTAPKKKKKVQWGPAWGEAKALIYQHRKRLFLGLLLMLFSRLAGLVTPFSSRFILDDVIPNEDMDLLWNIAMACAVAIVIQAISSYSLAQVMSVAAQKAITDMRKSVQHHITRLPTRYFDSTKSGVLISRIMTDPEGIRNLVGTGLTQIIGGLLTASLALVYLFYLNWTLTTVIIFILIIFGGGMAYAFTRLRPIFRERGEISANVTGRLNESLGGVRVVKAYTAERREDLLFAEGVHKLFRNIASSITGVMWQCPVSFAYPPSPHSQPSSSAASASSPWSWAATPSSVTG